MPIAADEERILRQWTPLLLRIVLTVAVVLMAVGTGLALVGAYRGIGLDASHNFTPEGLTMEMVLDGVVHGRADAIATLGLMVLTMVPLVRVAFCFLLFVRQRSGIFAAFTAYVLAGLIVGVLLGKIG
jgi:uncharacterized membrane protein